MSKITSWQPSASRLINKRSDWQPWLKVVILSKAMRESFADDKESHLGDPIYCWSMDIEWTHVILDKMSQSNRSASSKKNAIGVDLWWTFTSTFFSRKDCLRQNFSDPDIVRDPSWEQLRGIWEIDSLGLRNSDDNQFKQEEILAMSRAEKSRRWIGDR